MILRRFVLVLLCSAVLPWTAHAADIILDGEAPCLSIGGVWTGSTCTVDRLVVPAGTSLTVMEEVTLSTGDLLVDGYLELRGGFEATRSITNRGTVENYSYIFLTAPMRNRGAWWNGGGLYASNTVVNEWRFGNAGDFTIGPGVFVNWGYAENIGLTFDTIAGGSIINEGHLENNGQMENRPGSVIDNAGSLRIYDAVMFNNGRLLGRCGSAFEIDLPPFGGLVGNPIEFEPCQPSGAVAALGRSVLAFGQRGMHAKGDTIVLFRLLAKAFKQLEAGRTAEAVAILRAFNAAVSARLSYSPVAGSLILRSNSAIQLITNP
jgi:hypothetical protein